MAAPADARREQLVGLGLLAALAASLAGALLVRVPEDAGLSFSLVRHGPHLLLALAVGAGFGVAGVVQAARSAAGPGHPLLLAVATGGASGGMLLAGRELLPALPGFLVGALAGAALFAAAVRGALALPVARRLVVGLLLLAMLGAGVLAAIQAKGDPTGLRPLAFWLLGDLSRARWITALPVSVAVAALAASIVRATPRGASFDALPDDVRSGLEARAALLFGLCLGAAGLVAFFALIVAVVARWLVAGAGLRASATVAAALGALAMVWADALPAALFGGLAPPLGIGVAALAIPWYWLRAEGGSSRPARVAEIALAVAVAAVVGLGIYVLSTLAKFIA